MKFYTIILSLFLFVSCSLKNNNEFIFTSKNKYYVDTIFKTIKTKFNEGYIGGIDLFNNDTINKIVYNFCKTNRVKIIDIESNKVDEIINYNPSCEFIYTDVKDSFYYTLTNNILCKTSKFNNSNAIFYNLRNYEGYRKTGLCPGAIKPGGDQHVNVPKNIFYFRTSIDYENESGIYSNRVYNYPIFCKLNLDDFTFKYFGKDHMTNFGYLDNTFDLYKGDSILISYSQNATIEIINTISGKVSKKNIKSIFDNCKIKKWNGRKIRDDIKNEKFKHALLNPSYESLFYNPYNKKYYRVFHPKLDEFDQDGLQNSESNKRSILMIFDENLKLIDEFILPYNTLQILKIYPTKKGVEILLPNLINSNKGITSKAYLIINHD